MHADPHSVALALPKGSMEAGVLRLLEDAGLPVSLDARAYRPLLGLEGYECKLLKPQNIVEMLHAGSRDLGFTGADWVAELDGKLIELLDTGLDPVRIVAAAPESALQDGALPDTPLVVASEYERLTRAWIAERRLTARFVHSYGATEVFPPRGRRLHRRQHPDRGHPGRERPRRRGRADAIVHPPLCESEGDGSGRQASPHRGFRAPRALGAGRTPACDAGGQRGGGAARGGGRRTAVHARTHHRDPAPRPGLCRESGGTAARPAHPDPCGEGVGRHRPRESAVWTRSSSEETEMALPIPAAIVAEAEPYRAPRSDRPVSMRLHASEGPPPPPALLEAMLAQGPRCREPLPRRRAPGGAACTARGPRPRARAGDGRSGRGDRPGLPGLPRGRPEPGAARPRLRDDRQVREARRCEAPVLPVDAGSLPGGGGARAGGRRPRRHRPRHAPQPHRARDGRSGSARGGGRGARRARAGGPRLRRLRRPRPHRTRTGVRARGGGADPVEGVGPRRASRRVRVRPSRGHRPPACGRRPLRGVDDVAVAGRAVAAHRRVLPAGLRRGGEGAPGAYCGPAPGGGGEGVAFAGELRLRPSRRRRRGARGARRTGHRGTGLSRPPESSATVCVSAVRPTRKRCSASATPSSRSWKVRPDDAAPCQRHARDTRDAGGSRARARACREHHRHRAPLSRPHAGQPLPPRRLRAAPPGRGRSRDRRSPQRGGLRPRGGTGPRRGARRPARHRALRLRLRAARRGPRPRGDRPLGPALRTRRARPAAGTPRHPRLRERDPRDRLARRRRAPPPCTWSCCAGRTITTGPRRRSRRSPLALRMAVAPTGSSEVPSTKGVL